MQYSNKNSTDIQKPMHWHTLLTSYNNTLLTSHVNTAHQSEQHTAHK